MTTALLSTLRYAAVTDRLADLGGAKWEMHLRAKAMQAAGVPVIALTIGEPDVPPPPSRPAQAGRTAYSAGRGEPGLVHALAERYSVRRGRRIAPDQVLCLPGTQTTLYTVLAGLAGPGDEVLCGDPMYATYEGVIAASGARLVPVPLRAEYGFRMQAGDLAARVTPASRVVVLNTPHNPTGAVLSAADIAALAEVAVAHNLWIVCDEVYEDLVFEGVAFASPLDDPALADRVIVASSISKSHAAPGFRSGWCIGPAEFVTRVLPLAEMMLFGNQPFIADMTAAAVSAPSPVAAGMAERFQRRARLVHRMLDGVAGLAVNRPQAGMFALVDVRGTGLTGRAFAEGLLAAQALAVMPGGSFGAPLDGWLRVSLTAPDDQIAEACTRMIAHARSLA